MKPDLETNNPAEAANYFLQTMKDMNIVDADLTLPAFLIDMIKTDLLKRGAWTRYGNDSQQVMGIMYSWIMGYAIGKGKAKNPYEWRRQF